MDKVANLIDGGFYLKRVYAVRPDVKWNCLDNVVHSMEQLVRGHLKKLSEIQQFRFHKSDDRGGNFMVEPNWYAQHYRSFYYDAYPLNKNTVKPISKERKDFKSSDTYEFRQNLFKELRKKRSFALRLGETKATQDYIWHLKPKSLKDLVNNKRTFSDFSDEDFLPSIRQKGVDMRLGLDMASIALKKQANIFVIVTGDADFVPAAKLVRREGCQVILDPMWQNVSDDLHEHIDGLYSSFKNPNSAK